MRVFLHTKTGKHVGLSLKCMFSFFKRHLEFVEVSPTNRPDFFIHRNPLQRCVDLFHDKLRGTRVEDDFMQDNQIILMEHFRLKNKRELVDVDFVQFVEALPDIMYYDEHFWPQTCGLYLKPSTILVRLEGEIDILGLDLGISTSKKENVNPSDNRHWKDFFRPGTEALFRQLYASDFRQFGY